VSLLATIVLAVAFGVSAALYFRRRHDPWRRRPTPDAKYYAVQFDDPDESSTFMEALSRVFISPEAADIVAKSPPAEVWAWTSIRGEGRAPYMLYLNETSFLAASLALSPLHPMTPIRGDEIPRGAGLTFASLTARAFGIARPSRHSS
jgi:hypothetical protein